MIIIIEAKEKIILLQGNLNQRDCPPKKIDRLVHFSKWLKT